MNILFRFCSIFCIAANIPITILAENLQLEENAKPDVNCLLFGNAACHSTCALIGKLYVDGGEGTCDESFHCGCKLYQPTSVDDIWYSKFDRNTQSTALLNQLKNNQELSEYKAALNIVKNPLLTNKETKNLLTELLPNSELAKSLKPSNGQLISKYVNDIDSFNENDFKKLSDFVKTELSTIPEKITDEIAKSNYKERMNKFVDQVKDKVTIRYVIKQLEMMGSLYIAQILKKLEKENGIWSVEDSKSENNQEDEEVIAIQELELEEIKEQEEKPSKKVADAISAFVTNALIAYVDENQISPKIIKEKFPTRLQESDNSDSISNIAKGKLNTQTANKTKTKYSSSQWKPAVRAISNVTNVNGSVKREWKGYNSYIKYSKEYYGTINVYWKSDDVTITLRNSYMGDVNQTWKFGDVEINLNNDYMGNIDHKWDFGTTEYIYTKSYIGDKSFGWTGTEDLDALNKYKDYIRSWCSQNTNLVPNKCIIFAY